MWTANHSSSVESSGQPTWQAGQKWRNNDGSENADMIRRIRRKQPDMTEEKWSGFSTYLKAEASDILSQRRKAFLNGEAFPKLSNALIDDICFEFCSAGDARYKAIRERHYVPNKGAQGRQVHFLIWYKNSIVGIISGGSSVWSNKHRDKFFGITKENCEKVLGGIINNTVFRLECHEKNLGSRVLSMWMKVAAYIWEEIYGVKVFGFETFIENNGIRNGSMYKASNWTNVSETGAKP